MPIHDGLNIRKNTGHSLCFIDNDPFCIGGKKSPRVLQREFAVINIFEGDVL